jgi:hypothetical protein
MITTLVLTALFAQAGASESAKTARVEGIVVSSTTGDPLKKAVVQLSDKYAATTDTQGAFLFDNVTPGTYDLKAERVGYVSPTILTVGTVANLRLLAGQKLTGVTIKLAPQGAIYGRVTDEDGDPVREAGIDLLHWTYKNGKKVLQSVENSGQWNVNDDGSFVIGYLPAGRYYLRTTHGIQIVAPPQKEGHEEAYVATYFPSAIDPSAAAPIDIAAGMEVRGIELRLRKSRVFTVRGKVGTVPAGIQLAPRGYATVRQTSASTDGSFEFKNVPPGAYRLATMASFEAPALGPAYVVVTDSNVDGIALIKNAGVRVTGTVKMSDSTTRPSGARISLARSEGAADFDVDREDGTFGMINQEPDKYRIWVRGLPVGFYVKAVKAGDLNVTHKTLDLTSASSVELEITLSPNAADVSGIASNAKGDPVANAYIQLASDDDPEADETTFTDQNGVFHTHNLAPGDYRAFAWQDDGDGIIFDPEFRKRFDAKSFKVTLIEKSHENVELKLITKESMDAEVVKMP